MSFCGLRKGWHSRQRSETKDRASAKEADEMGGNYNIMREAGVKREIICIICQLKGIFGELTMDL